MMDKHDEYQKGFEDATTRRGKALRKFEGASTAFRGLGDLYDKVASAQARQKWPEYEEACAKLNTFAASVLQDFRAAIDEERQAVDDMVFYMLVLGKHDAEVRLAGMLQIHTFARTWPAQAQEAARSIEVACEQLKADVAHSLDQASQFAALAISKTDD